MFEKTKSAFGCFAIEVIEMVEEMKQRGVPHKKIAQTIDLWLEKEAHLLLVRVDLADPAAVYLSTPAMAKVGWEICIQIGKEVNKMLCVCPE